MCFNRVIVQKNTANFAVFSFAGAVGIEPTQEVLETPVLPLYYAPMYGIRQHPRRGKR